MTRKMKDSGIEWIGEIPEDWEITKLKNVLFDKVEKNDSDNPIVLSLARAGIKVRDISNNEGQLAESYLNYNKVSYGDLLLNPMDLISGANCNISEVEGVISPAYFNLNPIDNNNIYYYGYYFKLQYWNMVLFAHGKGVSFENRWTLNRETLLNYYLPVPPISKQKAITNFLDKKTQEIDNIISKTKKAIEEYKRYKQSLITETVTKGLDKNVQMKDSEIEWIGKIPEHWDIIRPNRVCKILRGNSSFQKTDLESKGDYIALQYGRTYKVDIVDDSYRHYVDRSFYKSDQIVENGDTVLISTSETMEDLGHSCFYNRDDIGLLGGEQMCLKPNKDNVQGKFLYYATKYFHIELNQYATGLKVYRFRLDDLKKINMVLPPKDEQYKIISFLDEKLPLIDQIISTKEKLLIEMEAYKKSLIYETVTGKREVE